TATTPAETPTDCLRSRRIRSAARQLQLRPVSKEVRRPTRRRCLTRVVAMGCESRRADFPSAFVAGDEITATHFELRIGRAWHSVRVGLSACRGLPALPT